MLSSRLRSVNHVCSSAQSRLGQAIDLYRGYFERCAEMVEPGPLFDFRAILRNRVPRTRKNRGGERRPRHLFGAAPMLEGCHEQPGQLQEPRDPRPR